MRIKLIGFNARYTHSCLALFYVRNELEQYLPEAQIEILQMTINDSYYENLLTIGEGRPDYIFFSAAIWNSERVEALIRDVNKCLPETSVVVGGPQAEVVASHLEDGACTRVIGKIEDVGAGFYRDLRGKCLQPSYAYQPGSERVNHFSYPYRDSDFHSHLKNRHVYYESSRGCPFSCTYCLSAKDRGVCHKPLEQVEEELKHILSHRPAVVRFVDRTFNDKPERALAIWEFLLAHESETLFHFEISPDRFSEEIYSFLEKVPVGMFQFEIGIQSTNEETLKAIRRYIDPVRAHTTISRLAAPGNIHLHVDLILGLPHETVESFQHSFSQVCNMGAHYIQLGLLKILPDTQICHSADEYGYVHSQRPPYSVCANAWMDHETVSSLYWFCECVEKFYNTRYFCSVWRYLRKKNEGMYSFFQGLLAVCKENSFFHRAATQEMMCRMLLELADTRDDQRLFVELIRFDWLRCGHRFLPEFLMVEATEEPLVVRKRLYQTQPEEMEGLYERKSRNRFFKRGLFIRFSRNAMKELGFGEQGSGRYLRFSHQREDSLQRFNRVALI